ncbi:MAG: PfkB family carbohydrate kinase [Candidatus Micrarchaeota archaeon]
MGDLSKLLNSFKGKRVLIVGDLMLDEYYSGEISRVSPEAPVPIVDASSHYFCLGGAANVANNVMALGGTANVVGLVGRDEASQRIRKLAASAGIGMANSVEDVSRPTTKKMRILGHGRHMIRVDEEVATPCGKAIEAKILKSFFRELPNADAVVVSDYNKGAITKAIANTVVEEAKKRGIPSVVDSKNYLNYGISEASILKPNLLELSKETGIGISSALDAKKAGMDLFLRLRPLGLLVTMGEKGMLLFDENESFLIPGIRAKAVDVSGAGDSVAATMALCLACKASLRDSASVANLAAAVVVEKVGTAAPSISEILALKKRSG